MSQWIKIRVRYSQQSTPYQMEMSAKSPKLLQQNDQHYIHKYHMKENPYLRTKQLEKVLGHITHACLLSSPTLSVLRHCYDYVKSRYHRPGKLWPSVLAELQNVKGLIPLMMAEWNLPYAPKIYCADACESGYAAHEALTSKVLRDVRSVSAWSERWRFAW